MAIQYAKKLLNHKFTKFLISGGFNTAITYGVYLLLLSYIPYSISYTISYLFGILIAYVLNRYFVFNSHRGLKSAVLLPLIYLLQYGLNLLILWYWVEKLGFEVRLAPIATIIVTIPLTYALSKLVFLKRGPRKQLKK